MHNLFIGSGCSRATAGRKELMNNVSGFPSLSAGSALDLVEDEQGVKYNFLLAEDRQRCRARLRAERPWLDVGSRPQARYLFHLAGTTCTKSSARLWCCSALTPRAHPR